MKALHDDKNKRKFGHRIPGMNKPYFVDAKDGRLKFDRRDYWPNPAKMMWFKLRIGAYKR